MRVKLAKMANSAAQPARQKSSMMERLRRLRSHSTTTTTQTLGRPVAAAPRHEDGDPPPGYKNQPRHREDVLDLEKLDSKLREYAELHSQDWEEDVGGDDDDDDAHGPSRPSNRSRRDQRPAADAKHPPEPGGGGGGDGGGTAPATKASPPPRTKSPAKPKDTIEIIIHPPEEDMASADLEETGPSDYELFLRQAEQAERRREETGQPRLPKTQQQQQRQQQQQQAGAPLNHFYTHDFADSSTAPAKLTGIQESEEDQTPNDHHHYHHAAKGGDEKEKSPPSSLTTSSNDDDDDASSYARPSGPFAFHGGGSGGGGGGGGTGSSCGNSGSHDFAGTPEAREQQNQPARFVVVPPRPGRQVSFCEPLRLKARSDSYCSAYHARGGYESPRAPYGAGARARAKAKAGSLDRRRSFKQVMTDYIRHI